MEIDLKSNLKSSFVMLIVILLKVFYLIINRLHYFNIHILISAIINTETAIAIYILLVAIYMTI